MSHLGASIRTVGMLAFVLLVLVFLMLGGFLSGVLILGF